MKPQTPQSIVLDKQVEGFMLVKSCLMWRRRYFTLCNGVLTCRQDHNVYSRFLFKAEVQQVSFLHQASRHTLVIQLVNGNEVKCCAFTPEEATMWLEAIQKHTNPKQKLRRVSSAALCVRLPNLAGPVRT